MNREVYLTKEKQNQIKHHVALYGGGTQSTGMILYMLENKMPLDFAVFSDTGAEPQHVIDYKDYFTDYVKAKYNFTIYTVNNKGLKLEEQVLNYIDKKGGVTRVSQIPLFTKNNITGEQGIVMRQCTLDYKITPADRFIKDKLNIKRKNNLQMGSIGAYMGISIDEVQRLKESTNWYKHLLYPLIEIGYNRQNTIDYVKKLGLKEPPRSACYFCPFHSDSYWKYLIKNYPNEFNKAVEFDKKIRNYPKLTNSTAYLHRSLAPLGKIDFSHQTDLFDMIDECTGGCGV